MDEISSVSVKSKQVVSENTNYIHAATSDNTRAAYQSDIRHFLSLGFDLPSNPEALCNYLKLSAETLNPRTILRRVTSIRKWHELKGEGDPTDNALVTKTMQGISRLHGKPKCQALALTIKDLDKISEYLLKQETMTAKRNRAIIMVGYFGALRRSEIAKLQWENVSFEREGIVLTLLDSKTDNKGEGQKCIIPFGNEGRCPVQALLEWRQAAKQWDGPVFRRLSKTGRLLNTGISGRAICTVVQSVVKAIGLENPAGYSAHSLRRGFATESARRGASMPAIQKHGRWKTTSTVVEYVEAGRAFDDSAAKVLYDF